MRSAREIVGGHVQATKKARQLAERMSRLSLMVILDLEREEAPLHVFRWVAWGANQTIQRRRVDLVIYLRRVIERRKNGWLEERHLTAAMAVLDDARAAARTRGGIMPDPTGMSVDAYRAAIEGATKNKGARSREAESEADGPTEIVTDEAATVEDDDDDVDGESDESPVSDRAPAKRGQVLRYLSDAVREALASQDIKAAAAINDTIALLCAERDAG